MNQEALQSCTKKREIPSVAAEEDDRKPPSRKKLKKKWDWEKPFYYRRDGDKPAFSTLLGVIEGPQEKPDDYVAPIAVAPVAAAAPKKAPTHRTARQIIAAAEADGVDFVAEFTKADLTFKAAKAAKVAEAAVKAAAKAQAQTDMVSSLVNIFKRIDRNVKAGNIVGIMCNGSNLLDGTPSGVVSQVVRANSEKEAAAAAAEARWRVSMDRAKALELQQDAEAQAAVTASLNGLAKAYDGLHGSFLADADAAHQARVMRDHEEAFLESNSSSIPGPPAEPDDFLLDDTDDEEEGSDEEA